MPVVPSFGNFAPAPNLAEAYLGGGRLALGRDQLALDRDKLAQEAAADAARISLGREQIQAEAVANEMQLAAKREAMSRQMLKDAQEAEIEKAYRETQIGLRQRELNKEEAIAQMRIQDASRDFDRMQGYQRRVGELSKTMPLEDAARQAILESGGTGLSTALERPAEPRPRTFSAVTEPGIPGLTPPTRLGMTAQEFGSFMETAPPQVQTNSVNTAIQRMLQPPSMGTNAPAGTNAPSLRVVRDANGKLVIQR